MAEESQEQFLERERPTPVPWKEFLETYPVNAQQLVSDYYTNNKGTNKDYFPYERVAPILRLHCLKCEGVRNFTGKWEQGSEFKKNDFYPLRAFLDYTCRDCGDGHKVFCVISDPKPDRNAIAIKVGEYPDVHVEVPKSLQPLLGNDYHLFLKGLTCEKQGLGIGAFVYYRRVVESQKTKLIKDILKVAEKLNAPKEALDALAKAANEKQFARAVEDIKDAIPQALLVDSNNPLKFLHNALSIGVHNQTDEDCLKIAHGVRLVLADFSERLKLALEDQKELRAAIGGLAKFIGDAKKE